MYVQIGKPRKNLHPAVLAASGMFIGAAAGAAATILADEKNRRMIGNTIKTTKKFAKDKASHLQQKMNEMGEMTEDEMAGSAGGVAKKVRKTTAM